MSLTDYKDETYILPENESGVGKLYSRVDIGYIVMDKGYHITFCNAKTEEIFDTEEEEILGKNFLDFVTREDRDRIQSTLEQCLDRGYIRDVSFRIQSLHGRTISVQANGFSTCSEDQAQDTLRLYLRNVTDFEQIEQEKRFLFRLLHLTLDEAFDEGMKVLLFEFQKILECDGIGLFVQKPNGEKQCLGSWKHFTEKIDDPREDFRRWPPERWKNLIDYLKNLPLVETLSLGGIYIPSMEEVLSDELLINGPVVPSSFSLYRSWAFFPIGNGEIPGYLVFADRSSRRWISRELDFMQEVASVFPIAFHPISSRNVPSISEETVFATPFIGMVWTQDGRIVKTNAWISRILGYEPESLIGKSFLDFVDVEYHSKLIQLQTQAFSPDKEFESIKVQIWTKEGKLRPVLLTVEIFEKEPVVQALWYLLEYAEKPDPRQELLHTKKMETLGILAGGIILDFNNFLSCILGYSSLLSEEFPKDSPHYQDFQEIVKATEKAIELTSRLIACAQGSSYIVSDLDVNPLVNEVASILSKLYGKDLLIRVELDPELYRIHGDASQIQQAILELALNAKDAMPNGGKIVFQTRNCTLTESDMMTRRGYPPGKYIQIIVSDTGYGMTAELKRQLVEGEGDSSMGEKQNGIGLSLVRQIIQKHRGFVSVFSEKGKGTVVKLFFPIGERKLRKVEEVFAGEMKKGKGNVLLVEEKKVIRKTGLRMLQRYGYGVIEAENGAEALEIYKKRMRDIHLVILDTGIPGMDINHVLDQFYRLNPDVKILASVGIGETELVEQKLHQPVKGFIQKPYHLRRLLHSVRTALYG